MSLFSNGIVLTQYKEPAFSRPLVRFTNPMTDLFTIDSPPVSDISAIGGDEIIEIARIAQIVDESDGRLLYRKLSRAKNRNIPVVVDAVDDEPYVSSRINPLLKLRDEIAEGIELCKKVAVTDEVFIMAYKNLGNLEMRIPGAIEGYKISRLRGGYPARPQANLLKGKAKTLTISSGAVIHLCRAVKQSKKQTTVFVTVAGNCISTPMNMEVSVGMTVQQVVDRCGLLDEPTRIIHGGSMTGIAVINTDRTVITNTTRAVLAIKDNQRKYNYSCIACGKCEKACPMGLSPMYINKLVGRKHYTAMESFDAHLCIGCGTCSYVCPSRIDVSGAVGYARDYATRNFRAATGEEADDFED